MGRKTKYKSAAEKQRAYRQRQKLRNAFRDEKEVSNLNIISLFDYSGTWSKPYRDAGYNVIQLDIKHGKDVRLLSFDEIPKPVRGILAAPPCTHFSRAGARWWKDKGDDELLQALSLVDATMRIIHVSQPTWWVLENPIGRLKDYLGEPTMKFQPHQFGDPYTKRTWLWGNFNTNLRLDEVEPTLGQLTNLYKDKTRRSVTPAGFAMAFYLANP